MQSPEPTPKRKDHDDLVEDAERTDKKVIARLSDALASGRRFEGKAVNYKKDGTPFIMHRRVLPIKAGKGIKGWLAIQRGGTVG
jgi:hypothetical protein